MAQNDFGKAAPARPFSGCFGNYLYGSTVRRSREGGPPRDTDRKCLYHVPHLYQASVRAHAAGGLLSIPFIYFGLAGRGSIRGRPGDIGSRDTGVAGASLSHGGLVLVFGNIGPRHRIGASRSAGPRRPIYLRPVGWFVDHARVGRG